MVIFFPKRIKYAKENPVIDFYRKCMKSAFDTELLNGVNVCAFTIHPSDYKKLKKLLEKHIKRNYPYLEKGLLRLEVEMYMLDLGPVEDKSRTRGTVSINEKELYDANA